MTKTNPPKARGLKLPPDYSALIGTDRTCANCGEAKPIEFKTYAPSKKSPDGVSLVCRTCQGKAAANKPTAPIEAQDAPAEAPHGIPGWLDPVTKRRAFWDHLHAAIDTLYATATDPRARAEFNKAQAEINKVVRLKTDPAGGGYMEDAELAFRCFVSVCARLMANFRPFGAVHDDLIHALVGDHPRTLLIASRNSGKSGLTELFCLWLLHRFPLIKIVVVSGGARRADQALASVRGFMSHCPLLKYLEPGDEDSDNRRQFVTAPASGKLGAFFSFSSFGVAGNLVGQRADVIIADDVERRADQTADAQERLDLLTAELENILNPRTPIEPWAGRVVALGTPQVEGISVYARWFKQTDEDSGEPLWHTVKSLLFEEVADDDGRKRTRLVSRWPSRWTDVELEYKRQKMTLREWNLHWRCDLSAMSGNERPLKLRDFILINREPTAVTFPRVVRAGGPRLPLETFTADAEDGFYGPSEISRDSLPYVTTVAAVDPASGIAGNDELGLAIVSVTAQGLAVVRLLTGVRGVSASETLSRAAAMIATYRPNKIVVESRVDSLFPDQLAAVLSRRGLPTLVDRVHSGAKKGQRIIDAIGTPLADRRVVLLESVVTAEDAAETVKQITGVTTDARSLSHDDRVDALAWGLSAVASLIRSEEGDTLPLATRTELERLLRLSVRKGGIADEDSLEARLFEADEETEYLQRKLDHALRVREEEAQQGIYDPTFQAYIETLQREVRKLTRYGDHNG